MNNQNLLDISWSTILKIGVAILAFYFLYLASDILILTIFAMVISVLFEPAICFVQKIGVNRFLATIFVFIVIFGLLGFSVYITSQAFISEIRQSALIFPQYFEIISPPLRGIGLAAFENIDTFFSSLEMWAREASANILSALFVILGGMFASVFIFFLAFFFSLDEKWVEKAIKVLFPRKYEETAIDVWQRSQYKITGWFSAKVLLSIFVALATFVTLRIFKVDYALTFSLFAGITNIIPFLGPVFAGAVITIFVLVEDWLKALFVLTAFFLIQQVEGSILTPIFMKKIIGLPPALVLISLVAGGKLFGFLGVLLAIPLVGILFEFLVEFLLKRKTEKIT